ncbi:hypothetical protein GCM10023320_58240 [Pseudonocardia adelaidensis]|uniref:Uncharacterized protein n=1 Tax=Pseudonocardia adelaidensis TaxID=648754 RepID=A0ABP9NTF7_9PSEU
MQASPGAHGSGTGTGPPACRASATVARNSGTLLTIGSASRPARRSGPTPTLNPYLGTGCKRAFQSYRR